LIDTHAGSCGTTPRPEKAWTDLIGDIEKCPSFEERLFLMIQNDEGYISDDNIRSGRLLTIVRV
jgi:hypothetical protein